MKFVTPLAPTFEIALPEMPQTIRVNGWESCAVTFEAQALGNTTDESLCIETWLYCRLMYAAVLRHSITSLIQEAWKQRPTRTCRNEMQLYLSISNTA